MAPVFARLGVKLVTRNLAQGGLGTIQSAMGMKDIYGDSIDILLWDSGKPSLWTLPYWCFATNVFHPSAPQL
jgi:hypothetical protein